MLALPQLKALLKEHNLYRCYINKDEAIALLLQKGIITPADLLQPKDETKKAAQVTSNTDRLRTAKCFSIRLFSQGLSV